RVFLRKPSLGFADRGEDLLVNAFHSTHELPEVLPNQVVVPVWVVETSRSKRRLVVQVSVSAIRDADNDVGTSCFAQLTKVANHLGSMGLIHRPRACLDAHEVPFPLD